MANYRCGRRVRRCKNKDCRYKFKAEEHELWHCPQCGTDRHCEKKVKIEGAACRLHGGESLKGAEHPNYKGGGYSKYMPNKLRQKHDDFVNDPEVLSLAKEIWVSKSLVAHEIESLKGNATLELWKDAQDYYQRAIQANAQKKNEEFAELIMQLGKTLESGLERSDALDVTLKNLNRSLETTRRLVDTQRQIAVDKGEMIALSWVMLAVDRLSKSLVENIAPLLQQIDGGGKALRKLQDEICQLVGARE